MNGFSSHQHLAAQPSSGQGGDEVPRPRGDASERTCVRERTRAGDNAGMSRISERVL
jgi:hypothetical protein